MTATHRPQRNRPESHSDDTDRSGNRSTAITPRRLALGLLGGALVVAGLRQRSRRGIAFAIAGGAVLASVLGVTARIKGALQSRGSTSPQGHDGTARDRTATDRTTVSRSVTVGRSPEEAYEYWRDPDQFARIVGHVADVRQRDSDSLRWTVEGPRGREVAWETRFSEETPGERLHWQTPADATVPHEGTVRFEPAAGDRGTMVTLSIDFDPPGGALGVSALERLGIVPATFVGVALDRFKSLAETGEVPTLETNPSARGRGDLL